MTSISKTSATMMELDLRLGQGTYIVSVSDGISVVRKTFTYAK